MDMDSTRVRQIRGGFINNAALILPRQFLRKSIEPAEPASRQLTLLHMEAFKIYWILAL